MREVDRDFAIYVRARQHELLRAAYLMCGDRLHAEDLLEEALEKLALRWREVRDERPDDFVRATLYRNAVSSLRRAQRKQPATPPGPPRPAGDASAQTRFDLEQALRVLPPRQRAVLVLRYFEDRTEADTADTLGVPVGTVRAHARDALASVRDHVPSLAPFIDRGDAS